MQASKGFTPFETKQYENRGTRHQRGYTNDWLRARLRHLAKEPFCRACALAERSTVVATEVDHIVPHRGNKRLFWDATNWQSLCKSCHSRKSRSEQIEAVQNCGTFTTSTANPGDSRDGLS